MSEPAYRGASWGQRRSSEPGRADVPGPWRGTVSQPGGSSGAGRPVSLRLVADRGRLVPYPFDVPHQPVRTHPPQPQSQPQPQRQARPQPQRQARPRPQSQPQPRRPGATAGRPRTSQVRLTRRGRIVVTALAVLAIGVASMALAGAAQATGHPGAPAAHGGLTRVEVRQGQSMWSIAETYDPNADTRLVIQQVLQMNSLTSDQVQPGQLLWVPRD